MPAFSAAHKDAYGDHLEEARGVFLTLWVAHSIDIRALKELALPGVVQG